jgi:hypothetical protein
MAVVIVEATSDVPPVASVNATSRNAQMVMSVTVALRRHHSML